MWISHSRSRVGSQLMPNFPQWLTIPDVNQTMEEKHMMDKHVAIVTGGTRGIGGSISLDFVKHGYIVIAVYRSRDDRAKELENRMRQISMESATYKADVSIQSEVKSVVDYAIGTFGRVDVLVNNAGIFDFSFVEDMEEDFLDNMIRVNFISQFLMIKECVGHMKGQKYGRIINASSISSVLADVGLAAYGASKAAVDMLTKICAAEFAPYNITVNAYAPGIVHTDMTAPMIEERGHIQVKQIPINRFGKGQEVASLVTFLASEEAGYITGEIIGIDGGMFKVQNPHRAHEYAKRKQT